MDRRRFILAASAASAAAVSAALPIPAPLLEDWFMLVDDPLAAPMPPAPSLNTLLNIGDKVSFAGLKGLYKVVSVAEDRATFEKLSEIEI